MDRRIRIVIVLAAGLALAACEREISSDIDEGGFGNPTMNNTMIQSGQKPFVMQLGARFAAEVNDTVNFAFGSAVLDDAARATLREQADWIRQFPEVRFRVYGHTDLVGSDAYNYQLGLRRAKAVVHYFETLGISRTRVEALASFGSTRPVIQTPDPELRNRRTVTEVSGFVERHPTVMNGKYAEVVFRGYVESARFRHPANVVVETATTTPN
jgi:outer membrane protein OmpA-like peptidoglycan-associated protein